MQLTRTWRGYARKRHSIFVMRAAERTSGISGSTIDLSRPDNSQYNKGRSGLCIALWHFVGAPLFETRWLPSSTIKAGILRIFGAEVGVGSYIKTNVKVKFPWYLAIGDHCWIGEGAWIDNTAQVTIGSHVCISQGAYLCTGNHDWTTVNMKLFSRPIVIHDGSWIGARATLAPGVTVGAGGIVSIGSVVTRDIPSLQVWSGNPAQYARERTLLEKELLNATS